MHLTTRRCSRRVVRVAAAVLPALAALALPRSRAGAQAVRPDIEQGIMELRVGHMPSATTLVLIGPRGGVLLPLRPVLELTGLPVEQHGDTLTAIPRLGMSGRAALDLRARTLHLGADSTIRLDSLELVRVGSDVYLAAPRLAQLLAGSVEVDFGLLTVLVSRTPPFPAEQAAAAEARRSAAERAQRARRTVAVGAVPFDARSGGMVLDWGLAASQTNGYRASTGELRGGVALAGGDLTLGAALTDPALPDQSPLRLETHYRRVFPQRRLLRQLDVGDVLSGGAVLRSMRGLTLTNRPVVRDQFFSDVPLVPQLPAGWQYEVYQDGQLLGYAGAGQGAVAVPLRYGSTPVQVRMISPAGEQIVSSFLYQVPPTQLAPGRFEYTAGGGRCTAECEGIAFADVAYGALRTLTLGAGGELRRDSLGTRLLPQASVSIASLGGLQAQLQHVASAFSRLTTQWSSERASVGGSGGVSHPGGGRPSVAVGAASHWFGDGHADLRLAARPLGFQALRASAAAEGASGGGATRFQSALSADRSRGSVGLLYEDDEARRERLLGVKALVITPAGWARPFANLVLHGLVAADRGRVALGEWSLSLSPHGVGSLALSGRWTPVAGAQATLGYSTTLRAARMTTRAATSRGANAVSTTLNGSLVVDAGRAARPAVLDRAGVSAAGIRGRVFYDADADGAFGAGDLPAVDVPVLVAGQRVRTDSAGRYRAWNVVPFEVTEVTVDTLRSIDASWTPKAMRALVRATPHVYNPADFPLVRTQELSGALVADTGIATAAGVTLVIRELETQREQTTLTYGDGGFYVGRLRPGRYELSVAPSALRVLGATAEPARVAFTVAAGGAEPLIELPPIRLRPPARPREVVTVAIRKCPNPPAGVPLDSLGCPVLFREARTVTLRGVTFASGRAELTPASIEILASVAGALAADSTLVVEVAGHTDAAGPRAVNMRLSQARADAVRAYFIANGVAPERLVARGYGPDQPVASNRTARGRALNRRTELRRLDAPAGP